MTYALQAVHTSSYFFTILIMSLELVASVHMGVKNKNFCNCAFLFSFFTHYPIKLFSIHFFFKTYSWYLTFSSQISKFLEFPNNISPCLYIPQLFKVPKASRFSMVTLLYVYSYWHLILSILCIQHPCSNNDMLRPNINWHGITTTIQPSYGYYTGQPAWASGPATNQILLE